MAVIEAAFELVGLVLQSVLDYAPSQDGWKKLTEAASAEKAKSPDTGQGNLAGQKPDERG
jgi:hypothetical protein